MGAGCEGVKKDSFVLFAETKSSIVVHKSPAEVIMGRGQKNKRPLYIPLFPAATGKVGAGRTAGRFPKHGTRSQNHSRWRKRGEAPALNSSANMESSCGVTGSERRRAIPLAPNIQTFFSPRRERSPTAKWVTQTGRGCVRGRFEAGQKRVLNKQQMTHSSGSGTPLRSTGLQASCCSLQHWTPARGDRAPRTKEGLFAIQINISDDK